MNRRGFFAGLAGIAAFLCGKRTTGLTHWEYGKLPTRHVRIVRNVSGQTIKAGQIVHWNDAKTGVQ